MKTPVSSWLQLHPWLGIRGWKGFVKDNQSYPQGLVLPDDQHDVVRFDISLQDTNIPEGIQSHQQLSGWAEKHISLTHFLFPTCNFP